MSNLIQFLETLGSNAAASRMSAQDYAAAVAALEADEPSRQALLDRDADALNRSLGGRSKMMMSILVTPEDDEEKRKDEQPDDGEEVPGEGGCAS